MAIYKFTSVKEVIAKCYRDLNIQDPERWVDLIEWFAEALEAINTPQQLVNNVTKLCVKDYKAALPCNLYKIEYIYYNGWPLQPATSSLGNIMLSPNFNNSNIDPITLEKLNGNPILLDPSLIRPYNNAFTFTIDPCYIKTSFKEGDIYVSYQSLMVDEEGFPMIPDDYSFKTACFWYAAKMLLLPDWFEGKSSRYEEAEFKWQLYCGQAAAKAMSPDLMTLENIKNQWVRLLPQINSAATSFANLSKQERLNI